MPDLRGIDWFIRAFYFPDTFPRQHAQRGALSLTAHFEVDHAHYIARPLRRPDRCLRFVIPASLKAGLRAPLHVIQGIETRALFPGHGDDAQAHALAAAAAMFEAR